MKKIILFSMIFTISFFGCTHLRLEHSNPFDPLYTGLPGTIPAVPREGLIAEWLFNSNANDSSGNGLNGTVYNAVLTNDRFGNPGKAYYFNGSSAYIRISDNNLFNLTNFTICYWQKSKGNVGGVNPINKIYSSVDNSWGWNFLYYDNYPIDFQQINYPAYPYDTFMLTNKSTMLIDNDYFITVTFDFTSSQGKIYINNALEYTRTVQFKLYIDNSFDFTIGSSLDSSGTGPQNLFKGFIDDVRIYNRALSGDEIAALYHEGGWNP